MKWAQAMVLRDASGDGVPCCPHRHPLKPDVVLFEELLPAGPVQRAYMALAQTELLLCVGSSLQVHPVADFPRMVVSGGGNVAILTGSWTPQDGLAAVKMSEPLEILLPRLAGALT